MQTTLFTPLNIGSVTVKNRIGMAPMGNMGMITPDNCFNERAVEYFVERARGGAGLLITGSTEIESVIEPTPQGVIQNTATNPYRFKVTSSEMVERVHSYGSKIFLQLTLGYGRVAGPMWNPIQTVAPSEVPNFWNPEMMCRALSTSEVEYLVEKMGEAAVVAREAGFDGVEIHAMHEGYLLDQFSMSLFNKRTDRYGGDLEGRMTLAKEIVQHIKERTCKDFPVVLRYGVKSFIKDWGQAGLPGEEFTELGRDLDEGLAAAKILEAAGYDALNADCGAYEGWYWAHPPGYMEHGLYLPYVEKLKDVVDIPILTAGRLDEPEMAGDSIRNGQVDMVLLGRGLLADADWPNKVKAGEFEHIRPCLGCHDGCMERLEHSKAISCAVNPACGREQEYGLTKALVSKKILVVGGGVAGMEAARVAAARGHSVELHEKTDRLGGHLIEASVPHFKEDERKLIRWYELELEALGVDVCLNSLMDKTRLQESDADELILATGSIEKELPSTITGGMVLTACDALLHPEDIGQKVVVIGGGLVGCEVAVWLAEQGREVAVVEMLDDLLLSCPIFHSNREMLLDLLDFHKIEVRKSAKVSKIHEDYVEIETMTESGVGTQRMEKDSVISAIGYDPIDELAKSFEQDAERVHLIGDAREVANIMQAIWDAYEVARTI